MTIWDSMNMKNHHDGSFNKTDDDDTTSVEQTSVETTATLFGGQGQDPSSNKDDMIRVAKSSSITLSTLNQIPESTSNNDEEAQQQQTSSSSETRCCFCNNMIMRRKRTVVLLSCVAILGVAVVLVVLFTVVFQTNEKELSKGQKRKPKPEYMEMKKILQSYIPDLPSSQIQDETLWWLSEYNDNGLVLQATQQSIPDQRLLQRFVLALMYKSLDGNSWVFNNDPDSWLSNTSVCDWEKISCDPNNDNLVGSIDLSRNFLKGKIPTELGLLTSLTRLYMNANGLSGTIPSEIGTLTSLTGLTFDNNALIGSLPIELSHLTNLNWLYICCNQLTGEVPTALTNEVLSSLEFCSLNGNDDLMNIPGNC